MHRQVTVRLSISTETSYGSISQCSGVSNVKSPKHSKQGSAGSVKRQVESNKEGQHPGVN